MSLKSFRTFLVEALIDIDKSDIDKIYAPLKKPMKELIDVWDKHFERWQLASKGSSGRNIESSHGVIARSIGRELEEVVKKYKPIHGPLKVIKSSELKSEAAKQAHAVNPIEIRVWLIGPANHSNNYNPLNSTIDIFLPDSVANALLYTLNIVPSSKLSSLRNEMSELKHKSTIRHELTHWIDDSIHNSHIKRGMNSVRDAMLANNRKKAETTWKKMLNHGEDDIYMAPVEITPMVNQIAEYKRRVTKKVWDNITWSELMVVMPSLGALNDRLGEPWRKKMFTRLARENLIGKSFTKSLK